MTIVLHLPEDIARDLSAQAGDPSRVALGSLALEGYLVSRHAPDSVRFLSRRDLSEEQVRRMLGFESCFEVHAFLKQHNTYLNYTQADLEHDLAVARSL
jgi:hypothetical protein